MLKSILRSPISSLIIILVIAVFLRFYQLSALPPALTWDEVAWGYNAYSLGIDGRDEFGKFLPYDFIVSFGDYKPPMYAYLDSIPVKIFGLNAFGVRFPSAFFGSLTVLLTYFLTKELFIRYDDKKTWNKREYLALLSSLILAVSPWHIMLSRAAFEANVASFFVVLGVWLFIYGVRKKPVLLIISIVSFVLSMYTFNSTRIVAPLLVLVLVVIHYKELWALKKYAFSSTVVGLILLVPLVPFLISPEAKLRYNEVNIFTDISIVQNANQELANDNNSLLGKVIYNRRVAYAREFLKHYFDHFNPNFLFIHGDQNSKFSTQDVGQMYLWDLPFLIVGLFFLLRNKEKFRYFLPLWILLAIIPSAVARETPHALRIESSLPVWQIFVAYGFITVVGLLKKYSKLFVGIMAILLLFSVLYFQHGYYAHYAKLYSSVWQYGYQDAITYVMNHQNTYDRIAIADRLERPYIYTLFYLKYDPKLFRKEAVIRGNDFGFVHVDSFGKYYFYHEFDKVPKITGTTLYIDAPGNLPKNAKIQSTFSYVDGTKMLTAYTIEGDK